MYLSGYAKKPMVGTSGDLYEHLITANVKGNCYNAATGQKGAVCAEGAIGSALLSDAGLLYGHRYAWALVALGAAGAGYLIGRAQ